VHVNEISRFAILSKLKALAISYFYQVICSHFATPDVKAWFQFSTIPSIHSNFSNLF
jgi:hypothetical protein